jgi:hypothetical protein
MDMDDQCNRDTDGEGPFINTNIILIKFVGNADIW